MENETTLSWFYFGSPWFRLGRHSVKPWNLFNRYKLQDAAGEQHWYCGVGLLQINGRHLLYFGRAGEDGWRLYLLFFRVFGGE